MPAPSAPCPLPVKKFSPHEPSARFSRWIGFSALWLAACGGGATPAGQDATEQSSGIRKAAAVAAIRNGKWDSSVTVPFSPASMANLSNGKILMWAADGRLYFGGGTTSFTAILDPISGEVTEKTMNETGQNMFCPGTSNLPDGRLMISGGSQAAGTTLFDPSNNSWSKGSDYQIPRAYHGNTVLQDGSVLSLGGSWAGGQGGKHGERWTAATGWQRLGGVLVDNAMTADRDGAYRADNHMWLIPTGNGQVLQAGPSAAMNWIETEGQGSIRSAGQRGDDTDSMSGTAVMFDTGRILKVGGSANYQDKGGDTVANANAYMLDLRRGLRVAKLPAMSYARAFHTSVVLPNGQVMILGGQSVPQPFSDDNSALVPELFDPLTDTFTKLPPMAVARNYHSVALLLLDGRVISAGGNLGDPGTAHTDYQIYSPHYLFNEDGSPAVRPVITGAPAQLAYGSSVTVTTDGNIASMALVRLSSTTHTVNNDQRRLSLQFTSKGTNSWSVQVPSNPGWAVPGDYMLFAINAEGVPSIAKVVRVGNFGTPSINPISSQSSTTESNIQLTLGVSGNVVNFTAAGLPPGITFNPSTRSFSGTPTSDGEYGVTVTASNASGAVSTDFQWTVKDPSAARYVLLELPGKDATGNPWASLADLKLIDSWGNAVPRQSWKITSSSQEPGNEASRAIDEDNASFWHTQYSASTAQPPHWLRIDLGRNVRLAAMQLLPRQDGSANGQINAYRVSLSDGGAWRVAAQGQLHQAGALGRLKLIQLSNNLLPGLNNVAANKPASQINTYANRKAELAVDGKTDGKAEDRVSHTESVTNAWWRVDLGSVQSLHAIRIWNRQDCCQERLQDVYVMVSDTDFTMGNFAALLTNPKVLSLRFSGAVGTSQLLNLPPQQSGRFVAVVLGGTNFLSLAEVEVFARPDTGLQSPTNRAPIVSAPEQELNWLNQPVDRVVQAMDPDNEDLSYSATGLPTGLRLDANGRIRGTLTSSGRYNVNLTVTDSSGASTSKAFVWVVQEPLPTLPSLDMPAIATGAMAKINTGLTGAGWSIAWDWGDGSITDFGVNFTGAHTYAAAGIYRVTLQVKLPDGRIASRNYLQAVGSEPGTKAEMSSTIAADEQRIWVINTDNNSVSVFNSSTYAKLAEITVGAAPRTLALVGAKEVWVANQDDATISVINVASLQVTKTIELPRGSRPFGLVSNPAGNVVNVTLEATGKLLWFAPQTYAILGSRDAGQRPRHLAHSQDGKYVVIPAFITAPQQDENRLVVDTRVGALVNLLDRTNGGIKQVQLQFSDKVDTTTQGRGLPNYLGTPAISPNGKILWVPSKQDNIQRGTARDKQPLDFQNTVRAISSRIDMATTKELYSARIDHDNSGVASAALFHPKGSYLFVTLETTREVAVVDPVRNAELFRVAVGRAPQGLALTPDGNQLLVSNFMDRSVSVLNLKPLLMRGEMAMPTLYTLQTVTQEVLRPEVLKGKQFFYDAKDARLARDGYLSCAACHRDGGSDGRVWDFTQLGEGLRRTPSLKGKGIGHGALHWSGNFDEFQDFEGQIRLLAQGTGLMSNQAFTASANPLGKFKASASADLDALAAYLQSLDRAEISPLRKADGTLSDSAQKGKATFQVNCASCHAGGAFSDRSQGALRDIGSIKVSSGQRLGAKLPGLLTPGLRDAWSQTAFLHDGSASTVEGAIAAHTKTGLNLSVTEVTQVADYVRQIGGEENATVAILNIAKGKAATQSSTYNGRAASVAVDGSTNGNGEDKVSHTNQDLNAWWQVDLGTTHAIGSLRIWNRQDCCMERLNNFVVLTSETDMTGKSLQTLTADASVYKYVVNGPAGKKISIPINRKLRYVRVQLQGTGFLQLAEVEVFESAPINLALGRASVSQSSTYNGLKAGLAVDGSFDGNGQDKVTHTNNDPNAWWQVDLGSSGNVQGLQVWGRTDCCMERSSDITVFIADKDMSARSYTSLLNDKSVTQLRIMGQLGAQRWVDIAGKGRYVKLQLPGTNFLSLSEVQVFGHGFAQ